jgi:hypothetical protein
MNNTFIIKTKFIEKEEIVGIYSFDLITKQLINILNTFESQNLLK